MSTMYGARLAPGAYLQTQPTTDFDFGTGDFTVSAMLMGTSAGVLVGHMGPETGMNFGFTLSVLSAGEVKFTTIEGSFWVNAITGPTPVLDGGCHVVTAIRQGGKMQVLVDGAPVAATRTGESGTQNVTNGRPLTIGYTQDTSEPNNQFAGMIMNVGVWNVALTGEALVRSQFGRVSAADPGLQGYWSLDATSQDLSRNANPASIVGPVQFRPCIECIWAYGAKGYAFCQMTNAPSSDQTEDLAQAGTLTMTRQLEVPAGTPSLCGGIVAAGDVPAFPAGASVSLTDPSGKTYGQEDLDTTETFVQTVGGQLWAAAIAKPAPGTWRLAVTAPAPIAFTLTFNAVPAGEVVQSVTSALKPIYETTPSDPDLDPLFWSELFIAVAVVAVVVVVAVAVGVVSIGPQGGAVIVAVVAFCGTMAQREVANALPEIDAKSVPVATKQIAGMASFVVSVDKVLLIDQDVDDITEWMYASREKKLYAAVTASKFNNKQQTIVGTEETRANLAKALTSFSAGFVSICSHGTDRSVVGRLLPGKTDSYEEVLGTGMYQPPEAQGKIFHVTACSAGKSLGPDLVRNGAVAFFGYDAKFKLSPDRFKVFVDCDAAIDFALLEGKTCEQAFQEAVATYEAAIPVLEAEGKHLCAEYLESNLKHLVGPPKGAIYGNKNATLS
jgi:hypothetical protein